MIRISVKELEENCEGIRDMFCGDPVELNQLIEERYRIDMGKHLVIESIYGMDNIFIASMDEATNAIGRWYRRLSTDERQSIAGRLKSEIQNGYRGDALEEWREEMGEIMSLLGSFVSTNYTLCLYFCFEDYIKTRSEYGKNGLGSFWDRAIASVNNLLSTPKVAKGV